MHTGITGQIRKTTVGRWLLFHLNTGLFWIYSILVFVLLFSLAASRIQSLSSRILLSLPIALLAGVGLPWLVRALLWKRYRNVWMDSYVIVVLAVAIAFVRLLL